MGYIVRTWTIEKERGKERVVPGTLTEKIGGFNFDKVFPDMNAAVLAAQMVEGGTSIEDAEYGNGHTTVARRRF